MIPVQLPRYCRSDCTSAAAAVATTSVTSAVVTATSNTTAAGYVILRVRSTVMAYERVNMSVVLSASGAMPNTLFKGVDDSDHEIRHIEQNINCRSRSLEHSTLYPC